MKIDLNRIVPLRQTNTNADREVAIVKLMYHYQTTFIRATIHPRTCIWKKLDMQKIIGVTEFQCRFRPFFESVVRKRTPLILTRFDNIWDRIMSMNAEFSEEEIVVISRKPEMDSRCGNAREFSEMFADTLFSLLPYSV